MAKSTSKLFKDEAPKKMKEDDMNIPVEEKAVEEKKVKLTTSSTIDIPSAPEAPADDIQDVDISAIKKKKFRINGDNKKILELNVSDMNVASRMATAYDRLQKHMEKVTKILSDIPEDGNVSVEQENEIETQLKSVDAKMREEVDYIFQAPVSDICGDGGSMYDPFEGAFRFEHIIEAISKLYENNLENEFAKMKKRVSTKTSKYTKKYHN